MAANSATHHSPHHSESQSHMLKNGLLVLVLISLSTLLSYTTGNEYATALPIVLICTRQWYKHYTPKQRRVKGLVRLVTLVLIIGLYNTLLLGTLIETVSHYVFNYHIPVQRFRYLFPYVLMTVTIVRNMSDVVPNGSIRAWLLHVLYDVPLLSMVFFFKLIGDPINSLYSPLTKHIYLGCLPTSSDAQTLHDAGVVGVVNLCREFSGPQRAYKRLGIEQLHVPTVDSTSPSFETVERATQWIADLLKRREGAVFIHCKAGIGRSATVALCALVAVDGMKPADAMKLMKDKRPEVSNDVAKYAVVKSFIAAHEGVTNTNNNRYTTRIATLSDLQGLTRSARAAYVSAQTGLPDVTTDDIEADLQKYYNESFFRKELESDTGAHQVFVAIDSATQQICAHAKIALHTHHVDDTVGTSHCKLSRLYVEQEHQARGLGTRLEAMACEATVAAGCNTMWLGVLDHNTVARKLYAKLGYSKCDEQPSSDGHSTQIYYILDKPIGDPSLHSRTTIRAARPSDLHDLMRSCRESYMSAYTGHPDIEAQDLQLHAEKYYSEVSIGQELHPTGSTEVYVAIHNASKRICAHVSIIPRRHYKAGAVGSQHCELGRLYIEQDHRAHGLGRRLEAVACENGLAAGCSTIWLSVWCHNTAAQAFYKKLGYSKCDEKQNTIGHTMHTFHIMQKHIDAQ